MSMAERKTRFTEFPSKRTPTALPDTPSPCLPATRKVFPVTSRSVVGTRIPVWIGHSVVIDVDEVAVHLTYGAVPDREPDRTFHIESVFGLVDLAVLTTAVRAVDRQIVDRDVLARDHLHMGPLRVRCSRREHSWPIREQHRAVAFDREIVAARDPERPVVTVSPVGGSEGIRRRGRCPARPAATARRSSIRRAPRLPGPRRIPSPEGSGVSSPRRRSSSRLAPRCSRSRRRRSLPIRPTLGIPTRT